MITAGSGNSTSDGRLKDIISNLNISLADINEIPKVIFSWKDDPEKKEHIGTIAQALLDKFPQLVTQDDKGYYAVNYDTLSVVALHGIDKLYEENIILRERISQLDKRLRILEEKIESSTMNK